MLNQSERHAKVEAQLRVLRVLWGAFLMAIIMFTLLAFMVGPQSERDGAGDEATLFLIFLAMSLTMVAASFVVKQLFLKRATDEQRPELVQSAIIAALALSEAAALFGLVSHFITGHPYSFVIFAVAALGELAHFPRRDQLLAAAFKSREP